MYVCMYVCIQALCNCLGGYVFVQVKKVWVFLICAGAICVFLEPGRGNGNIHGKIDPLRNGIGPCVYVWMGTFPRPAWAKVASRHPYTSNILYLSIYAVYIFYTYIYIYVPGTILDPAEQVFSFLRRSTSKLQPVAGLGLHLVDGSNCQKYKMDHV